MEDAAEVSDARDYYRKILPFYEKESVSRAHLTFWRSFARGLRPRRILEIGAGLGRITAELSKVAPAVGLDVSLEMLSAARRRGSSRAFFLAADARHAALERAFDLIVAPGDPISHMTTLVDRQRTLRAVARQLEPGGLFVLEGLYRTRNEVSLPRRRIRHAAGVLQIDERWHPIGVRDLWHARYEYADRRTGGEVRRMAAAFLARAWNPATIRGLFASCGLELVELWGDFDRRPFRRSSSRLIAVARLARAPGERVAPPRLMERDLQ